LPTSIVMPASVANRWGANHTAESFSTEMKATEEPMLTSARPTAATSQAGASANNREPAATADPAVQPARPEVSARRRRNLRHV
jgi:hypothetical protein